MKIGEFMKRTKLSRKTAHRLYRDVFHANESKNGSEHRYFTEDELNYVLKNQYEKFSKTHNIKLLTNCDYPTYIEDNGDIWDYKNGFMEKRKPYLAKRSGYLYITVWENNKHKTYKVHRLVAQYFVENKNHEKFTCVNHIDGNKTNNHFTNLEWCDLSHNSREAIRLGLQKHIGYIKKPIKICDKDFNVIQKFQSMIEAEIKLNVSHQYLSDLCKTGKYSPKHGFYVLLDN